MTEKPEERVEKEETFIAPQEVVGNRVRKWGESGEESGEKARAERKEHKNRNKKK